MTEYCYTFVPAEDFDGWCEQKSCFPSSSDEEAEQYCANLTVNVLRVVIPNGGGSCPIKPRKLIEVATGRIVHDFEAEGFDGWEPSPNDQVKEGDNDSSTDRETTKST